MNATPASMGWTWLKAGFSMLRRQPAGLSTLFFGYMLLTTLLSILPLLGQIAQIVLMPVFAVGFMSAARQIEAGLPVVPAMLGAGFRKPKFGRLCRLGAVNLGAFFLVVAIALLFADFDMLSKMTPADLQANPQLMQDAGLLPGLLVGCAIYIPVLFVISFAAPIVFWNEMATGKALFYSFFAIKRAAGAFFVFAVCLCVIAFVTMNLMRMVFGGGTLGFAMLQVVSVLLYGCAHCALYVAYAHIFGAPAAEPAPLAKP
ncbi:hypothetical protein IP91_03587 [Pseudoduganella lurida]|uniref:Transmembrane protein n=1 Tax=Pseudoduganella lurida TaxID=1036180 RepID=A0A562R5G4_9BURK|nr:BPSS1780 family membrane protein [Pseudoduganella lurida]TWI63616.1 hypothetical protein IP91_03587 [Pseudoduganella lurida]